jgi:hypothetical protein
VSTFYLLPPRAQMGERLAAYLQTCFPGLDWPARAWSELGELLATTVGDRPDVYVVYRDDLSDGDDVGAALVNGFGAEPGDEVVEICPAGKRGPAEARRWHVARLAPEARTEDLPVAGYNT